MEFDEPMKCIIPSLLVFPREPQCLLPCQEGLRFHNAKHPMLPTTCLPGLHSQHSTYLECISQSRIRESKDYQLLYPDTSHLDGGNKAGHQLENPSIHMAQQMQNGASEPLVVGLETVELYIISLVKSWAATTQDTKTAADVDGLGNDADLSTCLLLMAPPLGSGL
ncbi:hypothetical protein HispidOSU_014048 [Sigmodon hispidus]